MNKLTNYWEPDKVVIYLDSRLYSKDAIFKCLYWYGDRFSISVNLVNDNFYEILVKTKSNQILDKEQGEELLYKLERDFIDYNLRDIVTKETKNIRDLLIAKAFSNGEFDEMPPGEITDPVGFDFGQMKNDK